MGLLYQVINVGPSGRIPFRVILLLLKNLNNCRKDLICNSSTSFRSWENTLKNCGKIIYRTVGMPGDEMLLCGALRGVVKATALINCDD